MSWDPTMKGLLGQILECNPKLRSLAFNYKSLDGIGMIRKVKYIDLYLNEIRNILKTFVQQIEILDLDTSFCYQWTKEDYLSLTNMCNLKCFKVSSHSSNYPLSSNEVLKPLALNCKNLECIEFFSLKNFQFDVSVFDKFFKERQSSLKRLRMVHFEVLNENIFRNLYLCQNIEELVMVGCFMTYESFLSLSQLPNLRTLKIQSIPSELLESAHWPSLERIWINGPKESEPEVGKFREKSVKKLISNSPKLKSIHFDDPKECDFSHEFLFENCYKSNIFISFGQAPTKCYETKTDIKKSLQHIAMERYFCQQDFAVYEKYQQMKGEFSTWLTKISPWFNCRLSLNQ